MKSKLHLLLILLSVAKLTLAQENTWDVPATEIMISHNKENYSDHKTARNNQLTSQATVSTWKTSTNKFKSLSDIIDKRLTSAFIVVADAGTLYNIYAQLDEMIEYEQKSIAIAKKHPWAAPIMIKQQKELISSGNDLLNYISLIVISYSEISKMKVSARKIIFHSIYLQLGELKAQTYSMYSMMKRLDITTEIKNSKPGLIVNKDKQIIDNILKNIK